MAAKLFVAAGIFHPEAGGPATYLYEILPELQRLDWDIRVLTYGAGALNGYPYPLTRVPRRALPLRLTHYALSAYPLLRWADVVYVHTLDLPLLNRRAKRVVKIVGDQAWERAVRKGWIPPTEDIDRFQSASYSSVVATQKTARARQVQTMDGVIVPSEYLKRMVIGWGVDEDRIQVIYNALPPLHENAGGMMSQAEARAHLGLSAEPLLLTAARLTHWKGIDHLITALKQIPDGCLLVAGEGDLQGQLMHLTETMGLNERVKFLGKVSRDQMPMYMRAVDYLALYSGYEGLSHTLLESLRAGTPVIASDKGGNSEVVRHGVNGLLVPYVNSEALAAALQEAFRPGMRTKLAANTAVGMERFEFSSMVQQTSVVLRKYV
jgi:glycosyltransferase involved in cell wall biosynthesis